MPSRRERMGPRGSRTRSGSLRAGSRIRQRIGKHALGASAKTNDVHPPVVFLPTSPSHFAPWQMFRNWEEKKVRRVSARREGERERREAPKGPSPFGSNGRTSFPSSPPPVSAPLKPRPSVRAPSSSAKQQREKEAPVPRRRRHRICHDPKVGPSLGAIVQLRLNFPTPKVDSIHRHCITTWHLL